MQLKTSKDVEILILIPQSYTVTASSNGKRKKKTT